VDRGCSPKLIEGVASARFAWVQRIWRWRGTSVNCPDRQRGASPLSPERSVFGGPFCLETRFEPVDDAGDFGPVFGLAGFDEVGEGLGLDREEGFGAG
jgi:hypothetical protein